VYDFGGPATPGLSLIKRAVFLLVFRILGRCVGVTFADPSLPPAHFIMPPWGEVEAEGSSMKQKEDEKVPVFIRDESGNGLKLTEIRSEAIAESVYLSRIGEKYSIMVGDGKGWGVEIFIPRGWITEIMTHLALMLERGDALKLVGELEEKLLN